MPTNYTDNSCKRHSCGPVASRLQSIVEQSDTKVDKSILRRHCVTFVSPLAYQRFSCVVNNHDGINHLMYAHVFEILVNNLGVH